MIFAGLPELPIFEIFGFSSRQISAPTRRPTTTRRPPCPRVLCPPTTHSLHRRPPPSRSPSTRRRPPRFRPPTTPRPPTLSPPTPRPPPRCLPPTALPRPSTTTRPRRPTAPSPSSYSYSKKSKYNQS